MTTRFPIRFGFLRHGQTDYNHQGIVQGQLDIPLNDTGRQQAASHSRLIADQPFDCLVVSDLSRAVETAELAAVALQLPMYRDARLRERHFGPYQNKPRSRDLWVPPDDGFESIDVFVGRICAVLEEYGNHNLPLFVGHGGFLRAFEIATGASLPKDCFDNAVPLLFVRSEEGHWICRRLAGERPK